MTGITNAYINALLADATYVNLTPELPPKFRLPRVT